MAKKSKRVKNKRFSMMDGGDEMDNKWARLLAYVTGLGRPGIHTELENLVVRLARENSGWGYDRIVGAMANLGHPLTDQTVGNILRRHGIPPAPKRSQTTTWREFIRRHMDILSGADFFTVEVLTWRGLVTYYVLFFIHLDSRRVTLAG